MFSPPFLHIIHKTVVNSDVSRGHNRLSKVALFLLSFFVVNFTVKSGGGGGGGGIFLFFFVRDRWWWARAA